MTYLQNSIYPFIPPNFVSKNGTVQLLICSTPSVYKTNTSVISIKMHSNVHKCIICVLCTDFVSVMQDQHFDRHFYAYNNDEVSSN